MRKGVERLDIRRLKNENEEQYIWRICQAKDSGLLDWDWDDVADAVNKEFRTDESEYRVEASYRKPYQQAKRFWEAGVFGKLSEDKYIEELREAKQEVKKEKIKLSDERTALNRVLREQSRYESLIDVVKKTLDEFKKPSFEYVPHVSNISDNDVIIHLTDLHYGVTTDSHFNKFNASVFEERLSRYLDEIRDIQRTYRAQNAFIILGGDLIQGIIHVNSRIEAKENLIQQIMKVSDYISSFVFEVSKMFDKVEVHTTAGNHSRSMANKEETVHGENFDLLVPFYCKKDLKNIDSVSFVDNYLDYDIATFSVRGHQVFATHGDKDSPKNVLYNMTKFARKANLPLPDLCFLGHRHRNGLYTVDDVKIIESGCVDGVDNFAVSNRLIGSPEQTVVVVSEDKRIKAFYDIQLS